MSDGLRWGLAGARRQTIALLSDIADDAGSRQSIPGEHHPAWIAGHLLLGDSYLLHLLGAELPADFETLIARYGPNGPPKPEMAESDPLSGTVARLIDAGNRRDAAIGLLTPDDLARQTPDPHLAKSQPTIGHHLQALVCHEGYHAGQLAAWRRAHGIQPVRWAFAP